MVDKVIFTVLQFLERRKKFKVNVPELVSGQNDSVIERNDSVTGILLFHCTLAGKEQ